MGSSSLLSSIFGAISKNEVSGKDATADSISAPLESGKSGWTIGYEQEDFNTNPATAQATLTSALVASGVFSQQSAQSIGQALTDAGKSSEIDLRGITDVNGDPATVP